MKEKGILIPSSGETKLVSNWYKLTEKGKELFKTKHTRNSKLSEDENLKIFKGKVIYNFN